MRDGGSCTIMLGRQQRHSRIGMVCPCPQVTTGLRLEEEAARSSRAIARSAPFVAGAGTAEALAKSVASMAQVHARDSSLRTPWAVELSSRPEVRDREAGRETGRKRGGGKRERDREGEGKRGLLLWPHHHLPLFQAAASHPRLFELLSFCFCLTCLCSNQADVQHPGGVRPQPLVWPASRKLERGVRANPATCRLVLGVWG